MTRKVPEATFFTTLKADDAAFFNHAHFVFLATAKARESVVEAVWEAARAWATAKARESVVEAARVWESAKAWESVVEAARVWESAKALESMAEAVWLKVRRKISASLFIVWNFNY